MAIAEDLKLKGLTGSAEKEKTEEPVEPVTLKKLSSGKGKNLSQKIKQTKSEYLPLVEQENSYVAAEHIETTVSNLAVSSINIGEIQELDEKVMSMMTKSENLNSIWRRHDSCIFCGKEGAQRQIKDHIEANHLEGVSIPCNYCEKTFRSRAGLRQHNSTYHK